MGGRSGLFQEDLTQPSAALDYHYLQLDRRDNRRKSMRGARASSQEKEALVPIGKQVDTTESKWMTGDISSQRTAQTSIQESLQELPRPNSDLEWQRNVSSQRTAQSSIQRSLHELPRPNSDSEWQRNVASQRSIQMSVQESLQDREMQMSAMAEFAMKFFRMKNDDSKASVKTLNEAVEFTKVPIQESLILYNEPDTNDLSVQCFSNVMQFMGDTAMKKQTTLTDCLSHILLLGKERELLRDEIYCQVIKQTTINHTKSSCILGWRLLNLIAGFFPCSGNLVPYVTRHLHDIATDPEHHYQELASVCEDNLQRSLNFGGRRNIPSHVELEANLAGKSSQLISVQLPGEVKFPVKIHSFSMVADVINKFCKEMSISNPSEMNELSIFAHRQKDGLVRPLHSSEYLMDFLLDDGCIFLSIRRMMWRIPLCFNNDLYVEFHYQQLKDDYLNGLLQLTPASNGSSSVQQIAELAVLQHLAQGLKIQLSALKIKKYLPAQERQNVNIDGIHSLYLNKIDAMKALSPLDAKIQFIVLLTEQHLFGSNNYLAQKVSRRGCPSPCIVSVNHEGVQFLHPKTQEKVFQIPLTDVQSMRTVRPKNAGRLPSMEISYGTPNKFQKITMNLKQAKELCHILAIIMEELIHPSVANSISNFQ